MEVITKDLTPKVLQRCSHVQRHMRLAISAFESISDVIRRPGMLDILFIKVDEICISIDRSTGVEFPKSIHELRDSLESLKTEIDNAGVAV